MICSVKTLSVTGIRGSLVTAECYISNGLPGFDIVGLPDAAVREARERVRAAVKNCGAKFPVSRITVNPIPSKNAGIFCLTIELTPQLSVRLVGGHSAVACS